MLKKGRRRFIISFCINAGLLLLACLLFAASFPSPVFLKGLPGLAWFAFIPVFLLVRRISLPGSFVWGALYGYIAYNLFNYWLTTFNTFAGLVVGLIYLAYFLVLFPLLKLAIMFFPRRGYLLQWCIWMAYEYLRTTGFLGYAYGICGYTQWSVIPLIQIARIFGVWGVSALVMFSNVWLANAITAISAKKGSPALALKSEWLPACLWILAMAATLVYGFTLPGDYSKYPRARIALVQPNQDPHTGGSAVYMQKLKVLEKLSNQALAEKPDLVAWNETAFAPRIYWHTHYRNDPDTYDVVEELMRYLKPQTVPFLIGTDDGRLEPAETSKGLPGTEYYQVGPSGISAINTPGLITAGSNIYARVDYNAAVMYRGDTESGVYRKIHLVPFTESFPWAKQLPGVYQMIIDAGNYMWKKGTEYTVFDTGKFKFSTPICFEDSFGQPSRGFVQHGAQVIVNITNDAWSNSEAAQMQHAAMAAFRAVENRRSLVRATATGQTCAFDPSGRLLGMAEPFKQVNLIADVPIVKSSDPQGTTFYTLHGDFLPLIFLFFSVLLLIGGLIRFIIKVKVKKDDEQ